VRELASLLGVEDFIRFTGYLSGERLLAHISAFDIGVIPDPFNEANDVMSMNKVFEYCALGIPTACYPLRETKRLLGEAGGCTPCPIGGRRSVRAARIRPSRGKWRRHCGFSLTLARSNAI
jgi:hypothetical protein